MPEDGQILDSHEDILNALADDDSTLLPNGYPQARCQDAVQKVDESAMTADFVIVTRKADINRNGHKVQIVESDNGGGLLLDNFQRNPVVLFDHGMTGLPFPIARSTVPELTKFQARAQATFSQSLPEAVQLFALISEGILNAASISFLPFKARIFKPSREELDEDEIDFRPPVSLDMLTNDLLEWSAVVVPADPGAIRKFLDRGHVNGERLTQNIYQALRKKTPEPAAQSPGWTPDDGEDHRQQPQTDKLVDRFGSVLDRFERVVSRLEHRTVADKVRSTPIKCEASLNSAAEDKSAEDTTEPDLPQQVAQVVRDEVHGVAQQAVQRQDSLEQAVRKLTGVVD